MSMALSIDSPDRKAGAGSPAAAIGFATFVAGIVVGLGFAVDLGDEFVGGLALLSALCVVLALLSRVAENTRKRVSAGEISYRAFFDHAVEGIFRTTPDGHYIAVNQALGISMAIPRPRP